MRDERTVRLEGTSATEVWAEYWQRKLQAAGAGDAA